jgi:Kef-type K+ transport system membrane component KefB
VKLVFIIALLLASSHLFGYLFHRFSLPRVVGEIFGGFLLGPAVMGILLPDIYRGFSAVFEKEAGAVSFLSWAGLFLLMLISGFEIQKSFDREDKKIIAAIFLGSTAIPFTAGWLFPAVFGITPLMGVKNNALALRMVIGIAASITAIPVISRIFLDLKVINSRFAKIVLTTSTLHDIVLWIALAVAASMVGSYNGCAYALAWTISFSFIYLILALFGLPAVIRRTKPLDGLLICIMFILAVSILDVNLVFRAFLAGIVIGILPMEKIEELKALIIKPALMLFIPVYFAIVGFRVDIVHHFDAGLFLGFLAITALLATGGTIFAARLAGQDWFSAFNLSVAMNTRGAVGIILATVALDLGIINQTFFAILVVTAMLTSLAAGYWFKHVLSRGWALIKA